MNDSLKDIHTNITGKLTWCVEDIEKLLIENDELQPDIRKFLRNISARIKDQKELLVKYKDKTEWAIHWFKEYGDPKRKAEIDHILEQI